MNKKTSLHLYPYTFGFKKKKSIFLWYTNDKEEDLLLLDSSGKLISTSSKDEIDLLMKNYNYTVEWDEAVEMDFDSFWLEVEKLKSYSFSSKKTCVTLLDGWNFLEDLCRTLHILENIPGLKTPLADKVYKKLYYGNNIEAVTPEDKSYNPIWLPEEISFFNTEIKACWNIFMRKWQHNVDHT